MELENIIQQCIDRNERAMHELYKSCFQTIMRVTRRYSSNNDDAVVLLNQGFLKIINGLSSYKKEENFEAWIKRIVINTCIDEYRKNKRYRSHVALSEEQTVQALETNGRVYNDAMHKLNADEIFQLISALPDRSKEVFNLIVIDGYSHKEVGTLLDMTEVTSRWYLHQARTILQKQIKEMNNHKPISYAEHR